MDYYIYAHRKKTTGEIFYIGKGKKGRAHEKTNRNKYWKHTEAKHGRYVDFLAKGLTNDLAYELEELIIRTIGLDNLTNLDEGGKGGSGTTFKKKVYIYKDSKFIKAANSYDEAADFIGSYSVAVGRYINQSNRESYLNGYTLFNYDICDSINEKYLNGESLTAEELDYINKDLFQEYESDNVPMFIHLSAPLTSSTRIGEAVEEFKDLIATKQIKKERRQFNLNKPVREEPKRLKTNKTNKETIQYTSRWTDDEFKQLKSLADMRGIPINTLLKDALKNV